MLSAYPACFFNENGSYSVVFPDLNYLSTCGDSLEQALSAAVDCLAGYLYSADLDGTDVPAASAMSDISLEQVVQELGLSSEDYSDSFINIVTVDVAEYAKAHFTKSIRKNLTIPEWLNREAVAAGINFSQVLQEALLLKLSKR